MFSNSKSKVMSLKDVFPKAMTLKYEKSADLDLQSMAVFKGGGEGGREGTAPGLALLVARSGPARRN